MLDRRLGIGARHHPREFALLLREIEHLDVTAGDLPVIGLCHDQVPVGTPVTVVL